MASDGFLNVDLEVGATTRAQLAPLLAVRPAARRAWNAAALRDFNVGVELVRGVRNIELVLDEDAVQRVAALGGRVVITAYQEAAM